MLSWVEHEKSFITSGPDIAGKQHVHWADENFLNYFHQPIKLKILATGVVVDVDSLAVIGIMRLGG